MTNISSDSSLYVNDQGDGIKVEIVNCLTVVTPTSVINDGLVLGPVFKQRPELYMNKEGVIWFHVQGVFNAAIYNVEPTKFRTSPSPVTIPAISADLTQLLKNWKGNGKVKVAYDFDDLWDDEVVFRCKNGKIQVITLRRTEIDEKCVPNLCPSTQGNPSLGGGTTLSKYGPCFLRELNELVPLMGNLASFSYDPKSWAAIKNRGEYPAGTYFGHGSYIAAVKNNNTYWDKYDATSRNRWADRICAHIYCEIPTEMRKEWDRLKSAYWVGQDETSSLALFELAPTHGIQRHIVGDNYGNRQKMYNFLETTPKW